MQTLEIKKEETEKKDAEEFDVEEPVLMDHPIALLGLIHFHLFGLTIMDWIILTVVI